MLFPPFALKVPGGGGVAISVCANAVCAIIETDSIAPAVRIAVVIATKVICLFISNSYLRTLNINNVIDYCTRYFYNTFRL